MVDRSFIPFTRSAIEQSIPERFSEQVERYADKIAVVGCGRQMTYRELDRQSNRIARAILKTCSNRQEPIAVLLDQSIACIAAILAVLKAGKIYVALEPTDAKSELERVIADCNPALIISDSNYASLAFSLHERECLNLDTVDANGCSSHPDVAVTADSFAYIFYTSGSTGPPKGVVDCHRNVLHNVMRYTNNLRIGPGDKHSLIQSCSFSGTVSSMFSTLLNGATLCPFDLRRYGIERLAQWIEAECISIFHSVPTIFEQLISTGFGFSSLRVIRLEGDQSFLRHGKQFQKRFQSNCLLANGLGTTETGLIRQYIIHSKTKINGHALPVGHAVEDMVVSLTDDHGRDVLQGEVGHVTVRSAFLAHGYWQRPKLTAATFLQDPDDPSIRVYRTGDEGRLLADDCLEYIGRVDFQAKIRGQRLDTAEIATLLESHDSIDKALVAVREDSSRSQVLAAYLTCTSRQPPRIRSLRQLLASSVTANQIPAKYVFLNEFPLDKNGKINKRALPAPDAMQAEPRRINGALRNSRQRVIAKCFADVLNVRNVGLYDNFFELGGDSLKATELLLLLSRELGVPFSPDLLMGEGNVFAFERDVVRNVQPSCIVKLQSEGDLEPLFCMHDAHGHVLGYRELAARLAPDRPVFGVQFFGESGGPIGSHQLPEMAGRYIAEMQKVQPTGPYYICGQCFGGLVAFEVAQQLCAIGERVALLALIDTRFPENLGTEFVKRMTGVWRRLRSSHSSVQETGLQLRRTLGRAAKWGGRQINDRFHYHARSAPTSNSSQHDSGRFDPHTTFHRIERLYRPLPYSGAMTLMYPGESPGEGAWQSVASESLDIVEIPTPNWGDHRPHLTQQPYVDKVAAILRARCDAVGQ